MWIAALPPPQRPLLSAVLGASGTSLLLLACESTLTALQPSPLPGAVSEDQLSLVPTVTSFPHAAMHCRTGHACFHGWEHGLHPKSGSGPGTSGIPRNLFWPWFSYLLNGNSWVYLLGLHWVIIKGIECPRSPKHSAWRVQLLSRVWLLVTPWTAAHQASVSITNSRSLLKLMSIESVMPSNHLILCRPLLLLPSIFPSIRVFSN